MRVSFFSQMRVDALFSLSDDENSRSLFSNQPPAKVDDSFFVPFWRALTTSGGLLLLS